jgi:hypothetical protein
MSADGVPQRGLLGCLGLILLMLLAGALAWELGGWRVGVSTAAVASFVGVVVAVWRGWLHLEGCSLLIGLVLFLVLVFTADWYRRDHERQTTPAPAGAER